MDIKRYLPQISAVIIFAIVTAFFFSPLVFEGKKIRQGDVEHYLGASKEITDFRAKTGEEALWTNSMFGGMPAYQISLLYPNDYVQYIQKAFMKIMPSPATIIFLCMVGFYFLLTTMKVDPWVSIAGAIAFGLSSYFVIIIMAGHNTKGFAIAYMAPVLMGVLITMRGRLLLGGAITALALALEIYSNHLQITYYLLITVALVGVGEAIRLFREKQLPYLAKAAGMLMIAALIGILPNVTNLFLTSEYGNASTRGKSDITVDNTAQTKTSGLPIEYATQWSYGKGESMTLMIPDYNGGASDQIKSYDADALDAVEGNFKETIGQMGAYFGDQPFTSGPVYVGAIICFLFILGLFIVKDNLKWWLLAATVLSVMLAWGKNFNGLTEFFFNHVPGYNKFRAVSMILVIAELTMPLLAMLAIREIIQDPARVKARLKYFYIAFALTGGLSLMIYANGPIGTPLVSDAENKQIHDGVIGQGGSQNDVDAYVMNLESARASIVKSDAMRSFFFILLAGGILWFYIRKPFGAIPLAGALSFLVIIDMWGVSHRYLNKDNYEAPRKNENAIAMTAADAEILKDPDPDYRVLNIAVDTWQDANTSFYHKSIGGYHGAKLKRIQELYENVMENQLTTLRNSMHAGSNDSIIREALAHQSAINMLNAKYIIYNPDQAGILTNRYACGNAWFVNKIDWVANADDELKAINKLSPKYAAVIDKSFEGALKGLDPKYDSTATIKLTSYAPNHLKYESNSSSDQLAVFSEMYYEKGWDAYIDGKPVDHVRADFVLRAMKVPAGKHQIEFKFEPSFYYTGEKIALAGSILLIIFVGGGIYLDVRNKKKSAEQAA